MKKYLRLRGECLANGIRIGELGQITGDSPRTISNKINLRNGSSFTLDDCYAILKALNVDDSRFSEFFPRDGGK